MNPPLVVQVIPTLGGGGAEREVARVAPVLKASGEFDVVVCCLMGRGGFADSVEEAGVEVVVLHEHKILPPALAWDLMRFLRDRKPQIVHSHLVRWAPAVAKLARLPVAIMSEHGWSPKRGPLGVLFDRANIHFADRVVAVSEATRQIRIGKWRTPASKLVTIPNAVDIDGMPLPVNAEAKKQCLGIPQHVPVVGTIGRLVLIKGHEHFVAAAAELHRSNPSCHFLVVGDGPCRGSLEEQAKALGLSSRMHFLGFREDAREIIQILDVVCLSSLSEGTPITILEAMACAKPAVVTSVGGCPEVVVDGKTGFVVPPRDPGKLAQALLKLVQDPALARAMGEAGCRRVRMEYSVEVNLRRLTDLYRGALREKGYQVDWPATREGS